MLIDEKGLEASLRSDTLRKQRLAAAIYGALCVAGGITWLWVFWPATIGMLRMRVEMMGSTALGWVWILGGAALLFGSGLGFIRSAIIATTELSRLRRDLGG